MKLVAEAGVVAAAVETQTPNREPGFGAACVWSAHSSDNGEMDGWMDGWMKIEIGCRWVR